MKSIATFLNHDLKVSEKTAATVQLGTCVLGVIAVFLFPSFFINLSVYLLILLPIFFLYTYLFKGIYSSLSYFKLI